MLTQHKHSNVNDEFCNTVPATGPMDSHPALLKNYNAWSAWKQNGFADDDDLTFSNWSEMRTRLESEIDDIATFYWSGRSRFLVALDFKEMLESLMVFNFVQMIDHVSCRLPDPDKGNIELRMVQRSGGALREIIAFMACPLCMNVRKSLPIAKDYHLAAFAAGLDSPCSCQMLDSEGTPT